MSIDTKGVLPHGSAPRKDIPIHSGLLEYFPRACAAVASLSKVGNDQHNPGQPMHWDRSKSRDHADCYQRHNLERGATDDDGQLHATKAAWRALAALEIELEYRAEGGPALKFETLAESIGLEAAARVEGELDDVGLREDGCGSDLSGLEDDPVPYALSEECLQKLRDDECLDADFECPFEDPICQDAWERGDCLLLDRQAAKGALRRHPWQDDLFHALRSRVKERKVVTLFGDSYVTHRFVAVSFMHPVQLCTRICIFAVMNEKVGRSNRYYLRLAREHAASLMLDDIACAAVAVDRAAQQIPGCISVKASSFNVDLGCFKLCVRVRTEDGTPPVLPAGWISQCNRDCSDRVVCNIMVPASVAATL